MSAITSSTLKVNLGPAGRAMSQPMDKDLLEAFLQHLTLERSASTFYFGLSLWFAERELKGFSKFFNNESIDEQAHASLFARYLIARGQTVILDQIPRPKQKWDSIEEIFAYSFIMESDLTASIHQIYSMSERASDTRSNVFLDPVIEGQTKSEDEFAYILGKVKFANDDPSALLLIDNELDK